MKTTADILSFVNSTLEEWLVYKSKPVHIKIFKTDRGGASGSVSYHTYKDGLQYAEDKSEIDLYLSERLLSDKVSKEQFTRTLCHEIYHIIQYNRFTPEEIKGMMRTPVESNRVSMYASNLLELEAEVFTINLCGSSNHSYKEAKSDPLYRVTLDRILARL